LIKDDDDDGNNNNNNNNNNNSAQTVLKKGRLVHPKNVLLDVNIRNERPWNTEHPGSTYGLRKVKTHNINKCLKVRCKKQGRKTLSKRAFNFFLYPATYG
jgi:hypothetical protein